MEEQKERPILFSAPMVRALLAGRKTQTRRIVKGAPFWTHLHKDSVEESLLQFVDERGRWVQLPAKDDGFTYSTSVLTDEGKLIACPYGKLGDRLWVKETCYIWGRWNKNGLTATGSQKWRFKVESRSLTFEPSHPQIARKTTPKERCMYWRRNSIFMPRWASRITLEVTEVRVQRLQEISEADAVAEGIFDDGGDVFPHERYRALWESINGAGSWAANPWVWAVSFKVVQA